jgi:WD40 repeat protein
MLGRIFAWSSLLVIGTALLATAQDPPPPGDNKPLLRLEAGGPTSNVTALAFSPDGGTLYAAGFDKVVRVWGRNAETELFELDDKRYFRVPMNPGTEGAINAIAVSPDGDWLAVGGLGVVRAAAGFFDSGRLFPSVGLKPELRYDQGLIYVFSRRGRDVRLLRGHRGPIATLAFAPARAGQPALLVSAAQGWDFQTNQKSGEVRVWDVAKGESLGELGGLPPAFADGRAPGLAAISTGAKRNQMRVAIGWGDKYKTDQGSRGYMRIWDLDGPEGKTRTVEDGFFNTALVPLPDATSILAGSFAMPTGQLKVWDFTANPPGVGEQAALRAPGQSFYFPDALGVFAAQAKGPVDHAAMLVRHLKSGGGQENRLHVIDLRPGRLGETKVQAPLWQNNPIGAVLAATPRGRHVAVAGNMDHTILVYAIDDLLNNDIRPQVLHSVGATMRHVAFVQRPLKGKTLVGLALSESKRPDGTAPRKGDLIFDFEQRDLTSAVQGWTTAGPNVGAWQVRQSEAGERTVIRVSQGNKVVGQISVPAEQRVDAVALVPPQPAWNVPLVAVAAYVVETGYPVLDIYNAQTGKLCRRYTGHTAPISSLAVSADGKLLASAANDQTISVWSLTDLTEILGRHGGLPGVSVVQRGKDLVVAEVEADSPARGDLARDSVIQGLVVNKQVKPFASSRDFYEAFWAAKPGSVITVRIGDADRTRDVALTVDQGVDEQKPLFSLFVTRPGTGGKREWLGWNFVGPFDASGPAAESYLGWHFNTGKAEEPTKFALLKQYREEFFKKDILKHLVAEGSLSKALEKQKLPPPPRPAPKFGDPVGAEKAANGDILVRERQATLQLAIQDFALEPQDVVQWQLNGGPPQPLDPPEGNLWEIPLPELPAEGRRHRLQVKLRLQEVGKPPVNYTQEWTVRFQPPPPRLEFEKGTPYHDKVSDKVTILPYDVAASADYDFQALLHTPGEGPRCKVSLWLNDQEAQQPWDLARASEPQKISKKLTLKEGNNLIKVVAQNDPALATFEEEERHVLTVKVAYKPLAPAITIQKIESIDADVSPAAFEPDQQVVVNVPRVRIVGTLSGKAMLTSAQWDRGEKSQRQELAQGKPGKDETVFAQEVDLQPGVQSVRIFAKTAASPEGMETVMLLYRPQLPRVVLEAPEAVIRQAEGDDKSEITVAGKLLPPRFASPVKHALQAVIVHNGKELAPPIDLDSTATALPARKVALTPGANHIKVLLNHAQDWKGSPAEADFQVRYVRPPRLEDVQAKLMDTNPFVNLVAAVHSESPPLDKSVKVVVNGQEQRYAKAQVKPDANDPKGRTWILEVNEVPLVLEDNKDVHKNAVVVFISNAEDQSAPSRPAAVVYQAPPPPRPEIVLVSPGSSLALLDEPEMSLVFQVRSTKPLKRVEVTQDDKVLFRPEAMALKSPGLYEFATGKLPLQWGINKLKVEAINDGGPEETMLTLTVPPRPVELSLDSLRTEGPKGKRFTPQDLPGGKRKFPTIPDGRVVLEGKVRWGGEDDELLKKPHEVRIYVNGFQQVPVKLGPVSPEKPWERPFQARLILNLPLSTIEVSLPTLKQQASNRKECEAPCLNPVRGQHLHIVLVAPGMKEDKDLNDRMARALQATPIGPNLYKKPPVFDMVHIHKLTGYVPYYDVDSRLHSIGRLLRERAAQGLPNDVVMVYFLGQETVNARGRHLWTSETRQGPLGPTKALALSELVNNHFSRFAGAQALFLDLSQDARSRESSTFDEEYRLALFRHIQPKGSAPQLLKELESGMPKATWLEQLQPILEARFEPRDFLAYYPVGLKVQLNSAATGPK